jgi:MFS family permease
MNLKKTAILSISLLIVIVNSAVAPLIGLISNSFPDVGITLIKQVVTLPSLMIVVFSLISGQLVRILPKKYVLALGLFIYTIGGVGAYWASTIISLLVFRAILGAGTGLIGPLAISFITDFYSGEERAKMVGYSTFTSYLGTALSLIITSLFVKTNWRDAFFVYSFALIILLFTSIFIPYVNNTSSKKEVERPVVLSFSVIKLAVLACSIYIIFYLFPTDVAFLIKVINSTDVSKAASLLAIEIIAAAAAGILFSKAIHKLGLYAFSLGFAFISSGFLAINISNSFFMLVGSVILIGLGIGTLRPMIYFRTSQVCPSESTTAAFALINSGFSLGQFISPFFYFGIPSHFIFPIHTSAYLTAGIIFCAIGLSSLILIICFSKSTTD